MKDKKDGTEDFLEEPGKAEIPDILKEDRKLHRVTSLSFKVKADYKPRVPKDFGYERCFPGETLIQLADGSRRPIAAIRVGDRVCCWDRESRSVGSGQVITVILSDVDHLIRINGSLAASPSHRIMTTGGYLRFDEIRSGFEVFLGPAMTLDLVTSIERLSEPVKVFNLVVEPFACFFAEGFLVEDLAGDESEPVGPYLQPSLEFQRRSGISPT